MSDQREERCDVVTFQIRRDAKHQVRGADRGEHLGQGDQQVEGGHRVRAPALRQHHHLRVGGAPRAQDPRLSRSGDIQRRGLPHGAVAEG